MSRANNSNKQPFLAYGTSISTDLDLGAFLQRGGEARYFLSINQGSGRVSTAGLEICTPVFSGHGRNLSILTDREIALSIANQPWCFEVDGVARFFWCGGAGVIEYESLEQCTDSLLAFWMIHIFLPLYFTFEGLYEFIHACAVLAEGDTILFTAPSHGGKSTLTDFFLKQGHTLISDDKVATYCEGNQYFAVPAHPNHRPYRKFEELGYRADEFSSDARAIDAIYVLQAVGHADEVQIGEIRGHQKFVHLLPNYLFNFSFLKARRLEYLAQMVNTVPVYRVSVPWSLGRLREVHDAICAHRLDGLINYIGT